MKVDRAVQIPLPNEHAYHLGWTSSTKDLPKSANPYDAKKESELYEAWNDGYDIAKRVWE